MFEARFAEGALLKKILDCIKDLLVSGSIVNFDSNGLHLNSLCSSGICMVSLFLGSRGFYSYRCNKPEALGVNLPSLAKIVKCSDNNDNITLSMNDNNNDKLSILMVTPGKEAESEYFMTLMNIDQEAATILPIEYDYVVRMQSSVFARICRDMSTLDEVVSIKCSKDNIQFTVNGDIGTGKIKLEMDETTSRVRIESKSDTIEPYEYKFKLRYLNIFCKASPLSDHVYLKLGTGTPLLVEYTIQQQHASVITGEDEEETDYLRFYLAPLLE